MINNVSPTPVKVPSGGLTVFDFDGTITTKDTFALFLRYYAGPVKWAFNIIKLLPIFISYKLHLIDRHAVKAAVIKRFFKNESKSHLETKAKAFAESIIPPLVRPKAQICFDSKKERLDTLYICSASISPYLKHWAKSQGLSEDHVLAVELQSDGDTLTGGIKGYNVWGANKVRRINDEFHSDNVQIKEAYGDTRGDKELLNAAEASFYKPFRL